MANFERQEPITPKEVNERLDFGIGLMVAGGSSPSRKPQDIPFSLSDAIRKKEFMAQAIITGGLSSQNNTH